MKPGVLFKGPRATVAPRFTLRPRGIRTEIEAAAGGGRGIIRGQSMTQWFKRKPGTNSEVWADKKVTSLKPRALNN